METFSMKDLHTPIGNIVAGEQPPWNKLPIIECGEPLVPIGPFSQYPQLATSAIYAGEREDSPYAWGQLKGALLSVFLREGVAKKVSRAAELLPRGYMFLALDGFRPFKVQRSLFDTHVERRVASGEDREFVLKDATRFVSVPSDDPKKPAPHNTGGAVDLSLIRLRYASEGYEMEDLLTKIAAGVASNNFEQMFAAQMRQLQIIRNSTLVDMESAFDATTPNIATLYYERDVGRLPRAERARWRECQKNRRMLVNIMARVGLSNYPEEWWHYDDGNQFCGARTGRPVVYGATRMSAENKEHEQKRRHLHQMCIDIVEGRHELVAANSLFRMARKVVEQTGDPRRTSHPKSAEI